MMTPGWQGRGLHLPAGTTLLHTARWPGHMQLGSGPCFWYWCTDSWGGWAASAGCLQDGESLKDDRCLVIILC